MRIRNDAVAAAALYAAVALVWTWPLALGLTRNLPADFGDPLLNCWILAWDVTHVGRGFWNANIFYPHPLALAYSEHLVAQAVQIAPIYALTRNPILCYNLLFLSTFVVAGLGMYLLARELTGSRAGAVVAGLAYAFAPYRVASFPHLQVLSSGWMPLTLFGFRRYFTTGRRRALAGATVAWTAQNLSCGYYLMFFTPVVGMYLTWELVTRRQTLRRRDLIAVAGAAVAVALVTVPFVIPYLELRRLGFGPRTDVGTFSADAYAYFTADPHLWVWGSIARGFPRPEGALFPGLTIASLAAFGARIPLALAPLAGVALPLLGEHIPGIRLTSVTRMLVWTAMASAIVLAVSGDQRRRLLVWLTSPPAVLTIITVFAVILSFGPEMHARGRVIAEGMPYAVLYRYVPGFDGLRVPARFAMIVALGLAALGSFAIRRTRAALLAGALIVLESFAAPIPINLNDTRYGQAHLRPLPDHVSFETSRDLYDAVARLRPTAVVELPLGEPAFDVRYMFFSTRHWTRLVNGYSGGAPQDYLALTDALADALARPAPAWERLRATGATHVIVHEGAFESGRGRALTAWLQAQGAAEVASFGPDRVLLLR